MSTPTAKVYASAWNRWRLSANDMGNSVDRAQRVAEFFKNRVFPGAGINEDELKQLSISPIPPGTQVTQYSPGGIPVVSGNVELIDVKFWAPATAKSLAWPYDPTQDSWDTLWNQSATDWFSGKQDRVVLYQIFAPIVLDESRIVQLPKIDPNTGRPKIGTDGKVIKVTTYLDDVASPAELAARAEGEREKNPLTEGLKATRNTAYVLGGGFLVYKIIDLFASKRTTTPK